MEFCQIRSNSIEKDDGNYMWVSYGKPCPIAIPCMAHSSAIDHTIPFPLLGHAWSLLDGLVRDDKLSVSPIWELAFTYSSVHVTDTENVNKK